jgi:hypothetical protein
MGERIGRIGQIETDFFFYFSRISSLLTRPEKSVSIRPIRLIRSPIVSQNFNYYFIL